MILDYGLLFLATLYSDLYRKRGLSGFVLAIRSIYRAMPRIQRGGAQKHDANEMAHRDEQQVALSATRDATNILASHRLAWLGIYEFIPSAPGSSGPPPPGPTEKKLPGRPRPVSAPSSPLVQY